MVNPIGNRFITEGERLGPSCLPHSAVTPLSLHNVHVVFFSGLSRSPGYAAQLPEFSHGAVDDSPLLPPEIPRDDVRDAAAGPLLPRVGHGVSEIHAHARRILGAAETVERHA